MSTKRKLNSKTCAVTRAYKKFKTRVNHKKLGYTFSCCVEENHKSPLFGCSFRPKHENSGQEIFASVGSNRVSIYECLPDKSIVPLQLYADPDEQEVFYSCAWSEDQYGSPTLAAAGKRGIIRLLSPALGTCPKNLIGHGNSVNDLVFDKNDYNLLFSASKDLSIRLWNIKKNVLIAIFSGVEGHRDEVLSLDVNLDSTLLVSSSIDHSLKIWRLSDSSIRDTVELSYTYDSITTKKPFPTRKQNFPDFTTRKIHKNYVDCAKWFGEFVFSKSCDEKIFCWKPGKPRQIMNEIPRNSTDVTVVTKLDVRDCTLWFMKFSLDTLQTKLALGNNIGKLYVYDLQAKECGQISSTVLIHPECTATIRQTAFSSDGTILICVCDDGRIWKWDLTSL